MLFSHFPIVFSNTLDINAILTPYQASPKCPDNAPSVFFCACKLPVLRATDRYQVASVLHSPLQFHHDWPSCDSTEERARTEGRLIATNAAGYPPATPRHPALELQQGPSH